MFVAVRVGGDGRVTKYRDGFATAEAAAAHVAEHGGEVVDASTLVGPVLHWLKSDGVWSVSGPTRAERAARISVRRPDFLYALGQAVGRDPTTVAAYVAGVINASALSDSEKIIAKLLLQEATLFYRIDPEIGDDLLTAVAVELTIGAPPDGWTDEDYATKSADARAGLDVLFLTAAGETP